jgi:drug/metabolite transporter (DMT)-like permease
MLVIFSSFFYGTYGIWSRLMGDNFGAFSQGAVRAGLVVLILLPMVLVSGGLRHFSIKKSKKLLLVSLGSIFFTAAPIYYAMNTIGIGLSLVLFYACYFLSMQVFEFATKHRLPISREVVTIAMALLGIFTIYHPNGGFAISFGSIAAMLAGVGTGFNVLASEKIDANSLTTTFLAWLCGLIVMIPVAVIIHDQVPPLGSVAWIYIIIFACCSVASSWTVITAVKIVSTGLVGLVGLLEIVFGIIFGMVFFNESVTLPMILGSLLIISAAIPNIYELRKRKALIWA